MNNLRFYLDRIGKEPINVSFRKCMLEGGSLQQLSELLCNREKALLQGENFLIAEAQKVHLEGSLVDLKNAKMLAREIVLKEKELSLDKCNENKLTQKEKELFDKEIELSGKKEFLDNREVDVFSREDVLIKREKEFECKLEKLRKEQKELQIQENEFVDRASKIITQEEDLKRKLNTDPLKFDSENNEKRSKYTKTEMKKKDLQIY